MAKRLFMLNVHRSCALNSAVSFVRNRVESIEACIRSYSKPQHIDMFTQELIELGQELPIYQDSFDVLITILLHSNPVLRERLVIRNKAENWQNEHDIPLDVYRSGIKTAISMLEGTIRHGYAKKDVFKKELKVLNDLLEFRKE